MIDKQEFYHGAALYRLIEDSRFAGIKVYDGGFVTGDVFLVFKYRTKTRSPWQFSFQTKEVEHINNLASNFRRIVIAFICGGDGICGVYWHELWPLLELQNAWISVKRNFNGQYSVSAAKGCIDGKIPQRRWPQLVFTDQE